MDFYLLKQLANELHGLEGTIYPMFEDSNGKPSIVWQFTAKETGTEVELATVEFDSSDGVYEYVESILEKL